MLTQCSDMKWTDGLIDKVYKFISQCSSFIDWKLFHYFYILIITILINPIISQTLMIPHKIESTSSSIWTVINLPILWDYILVYLKIFCYSIRLHQIKLISIQQITNTHLTNMAGIHLYRQCDKLSGWIFLLVVCLI